jgi:hypothetical protein
MHTKFHEDGFRHSKAVERKYRHTDSIGDIINLSFFQNNENRLKTCELKHT